MAAEATSHRHIASHLPLTHASPCLQMAIALLLAAAKRLIPADRRIRQHDWRPRGLPFAGAQVARSPNRWPGPVQSASLGSLAGGSSRADGDARRAHGPRPGARCARLGVPSRGRSPRSHSASCPKRWRRQPCRRRVRRPRHGRPRHEAKRAAGRRGRRVGHRGAPLQAWRAVRPHEQVALRLGAPARRAARAATARRRAARLPSGDGRDARVGGGRKVGGGRGVSSRFDLRAGLLAPRSSRCCRATPSLSTWAAAPPLGEGALRRRGPRFTRSLAASRRRDRRARPVCGATGGAAARRGA